MWCSNCQHDNDAGAVFCSYCGAAFTVVPPGNKPNTGSTIDLGRRHSKVDLQPPSIPQPPLVVPPPTQSHSDKNWWGFLIGAVVVLMMFRWVLLPIIGVIFAVLAKFWWIGLIVLFLVMRQGGRCSRHNHHRRTWHH